MQHNSSFHHIIEPLQSQLFSAYSPMFSILSAVICSKLFYNKKFCKQLLKIINYLYAKDPEYNR